MATRRSISSEINSDEWYGTLSFMRRCLWTGLFTRCADDQGRMIDNPTLIRSQVFPYDRMSDKLINQALSDFAKAGKLLRYEYEGHRYIQLIHWWDHQPMQWAMPSKYPAQIDWQDHIRTHMKGKYLVVNWPPKIDSSDVQVAGQGGDATLPCQVAGQDPNPNPNPNPNPVKEELRGAGADAPPPPVEPESNNGNEQTRKKPDDSLLISLTEGGQTLLKKYESLAAEKGKTSRLKHYKNERQRRAFEAVYRKLNGELADLIDKGFARERTGVSNMLAWLEGCVQRAKTPQQSYSQRPAKQTSSEYERRWAEHAAKRNAAKEKT